MVQGRWVIKTMSIRSKIKNHVLIIYKVLFSKEKKFIHSNLNFKLKSIQSNLDSNLNFKFGCFPVSLHKNLLKKDFL